MLAAAIQHTTDTRPERTVLARWLLVEALLLGTLADNTLRTASLGLGWTIWILGVAATVIVLARRFELTITREQTLWLSLAVWSSALFSWRDADMLQFGNFVATLAALAMLSMTMVGDAGQSALSARIRDIIRALKRAVGKALRGGATLVSREAALGEAAQEIAAERMPAIRAVLITAPVVLVLGKLLGAADPIFDQIFQLPDIDVGPAISHALFTLFFAWGCAGWMRGLFVGESEVPASGAASKIGILEVSTALTAMNVLFGLFVGMQIRWLFGGASVVRETTGLSVAQYARSGFFELVTVAALVLPILLGTRAAIEHDESALKRHRQLALPLVALLGVIMLSAVSRMGLYVRSYGLTTDRVYALVFMGWLGLVFAFMAATVLRGRVRRFAAFTVLSAYAVLALLNVANPEAIVARFELSRPRTMRPVDWDYLSLLSGDAMPVVAPALAAAEANKNSCWAVRRLYQRTPSVEIAEFNVGASMADAVVLEAIKPHSLRRLCASSTTSPSVSLSR